MDFTVGINYQNTLFWKDFRVMNLYKKFHVRCFCGLEVLDLQTLMISVDPRIGENESALYLEIHKFSDPSLYLYFDQCKISDRLVHNMYRFGVKNFPLLPRGSPEGV